MIGISHFRDLRMIFHFSTQNARSKNSRVSIGRSQNSYNSLAKSSSGSSTGRFGNRPGSHSNRDGETGLNEEDPDHWITKYEQEMSTLQPRENGAVPTATENNIPGINLTPVAVEKSKNGKYLSISWVNGLNSIWRISYSE